MKNTFLLLAVVIGIGIGLLIARIARVESSGEPAPPTNSALDGESVAGGAAGSATSADQADVTGDAKATSGGLTGLKKTPASGAADARPAKIDAFREQMAKVFTGKATDDEQLKFWEEARTSSHLGEVLSELEEQVAADAEDIPSRMNLAQAYTVKLLGVPSGPEKGLYAGKAEKLWRDVIEIEPDHYEAQYSIATSLSHYPDFLNRTGDAIAEFEKAIAIQEKPGSELENPRAYLELSRLQLRTSDPASALQTLERARQRHPDHAEVVAQIEKLKSTFVFEEEGEPGE